MSEHQKGCLCHLCSSHHHYPAVKKQQISLAAMHGSASDYNPEKCLRAEVERFKATNRFTPMDVTGFYIQAAVVLDEYRRMVEALHEIQRPMMGVDRCRRIAKLALPMSEKQRTPNPSPEPMRGGDGLGGKT